MSHRNPLCLRDLFTDLLHPDHLGTLILVSATGFSTGLAVWEWGHPQLLGPLVLTNALAQPERRTLLVLSAASTGIALLLWLLASALLSLRTHNLRLSTPVDVQGRSRLLVYRQHSALSTCAALLSPAILLGFLPILAIPRLESEHPGLVFCLAAGMAYLAYVCAERWQTDVLGDELSPIGAAWPATIYLPAALALAYALFFSVFTIARHNAYQTNALDLGWFTQAFYNILHLGYPRLTMLPGVAFNHLGRHFSPIFYLLAPFFALYPDARTLLVIQSVALGLGAMPLYLLARLKTGSRALALALAASYLLYPALQGANTFDFHEIVLAAPLLLFALYFLQVGRERLFWLCLILAFATKEDMPLAGAAIGLYAVYGLRRPRLGWLVTGVSLVAFGVINFVLMPALGGGAAFLDRFAALTAPGASGLAGIVETIFTNPAYTFSVAFFQPDKLAYLVHLLLPVLFLPVLAGGALILLVPGLAVSLLSSAETQYSIYTQYSAALAPVVYFLAVIGVRRVDKARYRPLAVAIVLASLVMNYEFGFIFSKSFSGLPQPTPHQLAAQALFDQIPNGAGVSTISGLNPHLATRNTIRVFPATDGVDYILFDTDESANFWPYKTREDATHDLLPYLVSGDFGLVSAENDYLLLRRGADTARNLKAIDLVLGLKYAAASRPSDYTDANRADAQAGTGQARAGTPTTPHLPGKNALTFGPYAHLFPGKYRVEFRLKVDNTSSHQPVATLDAIADQGQRVLAMRDLSPADFTAPNAYQTFALAFETNDPLANAEYRVRYQGEAALWVDTIQLVVVEAVIPLLPYDAASMPGAVAAPTVDDEQATLMKHARQANPSLSPDGKPVALVYGPHASLIPGSYRIDFRLKAERNDSPDPLVTLDVATQGGTTPLTSYTLRGRDFIAANQYQVASLYLSSDKPLHDLEYRVFYLGKGVLWVDNITLIYNFKSG